MGERIMNGHNRKYPDILVGILCGYHGWIGKVPRYPEHIFGVQSDKGWFVGRRSKNA
jgi:hypothetical protein